MKTWNQRLAEALRDSPDYQGNVNRFAGAVGVSAPSVAAWVGAGTITPARDIKAAYLIEACRLLHVTPEWILFGRGPRSAETLGAFPNANVLGSESSTQIASLISRLQNLHTEVEEILSFAKGIPSVVVPSDKSQDTKTQPFQRTAAAAAEILRGRRREGAKNGTRRSKSGGDKAG